jgi:hypothetical protein
MKALSTRILGAGLFMERFNPPRPPDDVLARRRDLLRSLEVLHDVVRPLALQVTLGPLHPQTFDVESVQEQRWVVVDPLPDGVAHRPFFEPTVPVRRVGAITPALVEELVTPAHDGWDWESVHALVTASRLEAPVLRLEEAPALPVPVRDIDGATWVVAPLDVSGQVWPAPVTVRWQQYWGLVRLQLEARWELWLEVERPEYQGLRRAERALDALGFRPSTEDRS